MRTDGVVTANSAIQDAKATWLEKFTGAVLEKEVDIGSPLVQNVFKRTFYITARNSHFIQVFGRVLLGDELATQAEEHLSKRMQETKNMLTAAIAAANVEIDDAQLGTFYWQSPSKGAVKLTSRLSNRHLEVLTLADTYVSKVHTLWIADLMDDKGRARAEKEVKKHLRAIASVARELFMGMRKRLNAKGQAPGVAEGSDDDQHDDEVEAGGAGDAGAAGAGDQPAAAKPRARKPTAAKEAAPDMPTTAAVAETAEVD